MPEPVQVYEGDGVKPYFMIDSWRMWRGERNRSTGFIKEIELLGYIPKPEGIIIPRPPDKYLHLTTIYITSDTGEMYHWNVEIEKWDNSLL